MSLGPLGLMRCIQAVDQGQDSFINVRNALPLSCPSTTVALTLLLLLLLPISMLLTPPWHPPGVRCILQCCHDDLHRSR
jgi:hypothetical protein